MEYTCRIISVGDLWKEPELINTVNNLLFDTRMDFNKKKNYYSRLFNDSENFIRPDMVAIFNHEERDIGCCTLLLETNQKCNIIIENLCILPELKRNGAFANCFKCLIKELIDEKYNLQSFYENLTGFHNIYVIAFVSDSNDETNALKQIYFSCHMANVGRICNYIQRRVGNSFKYELPELKFDWRIFKEAFVIRICDGKILESVLPQIHSTSDDNNKKNDSDNDDTSDNDDKDDNDNDDKNDISTNITSSTPGPTISSTTTTTRTSGSNYKKRGRPLGKYRTPQKGVKSRQNNKV